MESFVQVNAHLQKSLDEFAQQSLDSSNKVTDSHKAAVTERQ